MTATSALGRGSQFLLETQGRDGLWRDFLTPAGEASEWPTGYVAGALHLAGTDGKALERAATALVARQHPDGGWAYNEHVPSDADSTACVLLFLARFGQHDEACRRAARFVVAHQRRGGGVATYGEPGPIRRFTRVARWLPFDGWCGPHTEVTATGGRALVALDPNPGPETHAAWRYVRSRQQPDGSWRGYWWTSPHYATLEAVELAVSLDDRLPVALAAKWAAEAVAGHAFATALTLSILVRAKANAKTVGRAISALVAMQEPDGGWASAPIMRIPPPWETEPDRQRLVRFGSGLIVEDQHRAFTSATCLAALARATAAGWTIDRAHSGH